MRYLICLLLILSACGQPPVNGTNGLNGSPGKDGTSGTNGSNGSNGTSGINGVQFSQTITCGPQVMAYVSTYVIRFYYQEVTYTSGYKLISCSIVDWNNRVLSNEVLLSSTSASYATGQCTLYFDSNLNSNDYWIFTNSQSVEYVNSNSSQAGQIKNTSQYCTTQ